jgi:hypothetical protein
VTAFSHHTYTARVLDPGGDIPLSLEEGGRGTVTLDASNIPHVTGEITLAVEDPMLLAQLDPRASRRVIVDASRSDTMTKIYTAWAEQRRNRVATPRPSAYAGSTWGAPANFATSPEAGWLGGTLTAATTPYIFSATSTRSYAAGEKVTLSIRYRITGASTGAAQHISVIPHVRTGNAYYRGTHVTRPMVLDQDEDVVVQWTTPVAIAAGQLDLAVVGANAAGTGLAAANAGFGMRATRALIEDGWTAGQFFDGDTNPTGELERTRWLSAVNASASVVETRQVDRIEWPPQITRTFNLGIRETVPDRAAGTVALQLASDEAILEDFAQLTDDNAPRASESSLRAVCNYVLGKIGAALAPGGPDANVTAYWEATNLAVNPAARVDATGWVAGSGASGVARFTSPTILGLPTIRFTATGTGQAFLNTPVQDVRVTPGRLLTASIYMASATTSRPARVMLRFKDQSGAIILDSFSDAVNSSTNAAAPTRLSRTRRVPPNATTVSVYINTTVNAASQNHYVSALMLHEGSELLPFFDGSTTNGGGYTYVYEDAPYTSTSTRTPDVERDPESLVWRAGISGMAFLHPLLLMSGLRLVCDEARVWTLRNSGYRADGDQAYRYGVNIETADERLSREGDDWFDAAVYEYTWTDRDGIAKRRNDTFALSGTPTKVLRVEVPDTPYPGKGRAENIVRRAQGRGRTVSASAIPTWKERTDQTVSVLLEGTPIQTGIAGSVTFDFDEDTVTVSSRTADTPPSAWALIPIGQRWIDSPVGGSWIGEVI